MGNEKENFELFTDSVKVTPRLEVRGTVFTGAIQRRNKTTRGKVKSSNVVKTVGYLIYDHQTEKSIFMEKIEAIALVRQLGVINATIRPRKNNVKDEDDNIISTGYHLNLHPIRGERPFTNADRLYPIFKLNKQGKVDRPVSLAIQKEDCTELLWELISENYERCRPKENTAYQPISEEEKQNRIEIALQQSNFNTTHNPFDK